MLHRLARISPAGIRFAHDGWLCRLDLETGRIGPELTMQFYIAGQVRSIELSALLTANLLHAAKSPHWRQFVSGLGT
jgi:hypothetical protein